MQLQETGRILEAPVGFEPTFVRVRTPLRYPVSRRSLINLVGREGFEPPRFSRHRFLRPACLPVPSAAHINRNPGGIYQRAPPTRFGWIPSTERMAQTSARAYITGATRTVFFPLLQRRRGRRAESPRSQFANCESCPLAPSKVVLSCTAPRGLRAARPYKGPCVDSREAPQNWLRQVDSNHQMGE